MKKQYQIRIKKRERNLYQRIMGFLGKHAHDGIELTRLAVYLVSSLLAIIGLPLHFLFKVLGNDQFVLNAISISIWTCSALLLWLYLHHKISLNKVFLIYAVLTQFLEGMGIIYMAATASSSPFSAYENIVFNEALCLTVFLITCMGLLRTAATWVLFIYFASIGIAYVLNPTVVASLFVLVFSFIMVCTWLYMITLHFFMGNTSRELNDYKQLQDSILDMFGMSKVEMVALVQMCRQAEGSHDMDYSKVGKLSHHTRDNLIRVNEYLHEEKRDSLANLGELFPQLTPTELEVCRLVLKGLTLKEIAVATNKRMGNIGTVRGNIRKKLGLNSGDDLRETLIQRVKG